MNGGTSARGAGRLVLGVGLFIVFGACAAARAAGPDPASGRELFNREWTVNDDRGHGGDGLGPVYNDSSCVACHNAGGVGGGGPASKNVDIVTAFSNRQQVIEEIAPQAGSRGFLLQALSSLIGLDEPVPPPKPLTPRPPKKIDTTELVKAHAGFRTARSVVLHKFGSDPGYNAWREGLLGISPIPQVVTEEPTAPLTRVPSVIAVDGVPIARVVTEAQPAPPLPAGNFDPVADLPQQGVSLPPGMATAENNPALMVIAQIRNALQFRQFQQMQGQVGEFSLLHSQRNPTALFGAGLIDMVPDSAIEAIAQVKHEGFPEIAGRIARQKDGRIGRFGWKGQTPRLNDFVLTACAVELGLEVPDHHQGGLPQKPADKAKDLDLTGDECAALVAFVSNLPRPLEDRSGIVHGREAAAGKVLFAKVGCANCHAPRLGGVDGVYSDLLLHDLGPDLGDVGAYSVFDPNSSEPEFVDPDAPLAENAPQEPQVLQVPQALPQFQSPNTITTTTNFPVVVTGGSIISRTALTLTNVLGMNFLLQQRQALGIAKRPAQGPAGRQEWKTPPLWGLRDSAPYLHDGRADTLEQTIALHGGEATNVTLRYFKLTPDERQQVQTFLKSLVAPVEPIAAR